MKPLELAMLLHRIAAAIENSKKPRLAWVVEDLKKVLGKIDRSPKPIQFSFDATEALNRDNLSNVRRAMAEVRRRRPDLKGKPVRVVFSIEE
jgi:hypothetical protein